MKTTHRNGDDHTTEFELGGVVVNSSTSSMPWYRSELAERVPRRYRKVRAVAFVVLGLGKVARKTTVHVAKAGGRAVKGKVQTTRSQRQQRREDPEWQYARRFGGAVFLCAPCRQKFPSARLLNDHFVIEHMDEEWLAQPKPVKRNPASRKTKPTAGRSPKTGKRAPDRAGVRAAAYQGPASKIGEKAMSSTPAARMVRAAGRQMTDASPQTLGELREQVLGMAQGLAILREGLEDYARTLRTTHGKREGLAPEIVNPHFGKAVAGLSETETALSAFIYNFEDQFSAAINAVARGGHGGTEFLAG